ncbi:MAG: alcohol dehydrogenase [Candidatus Omnitrophica bacterium CG11_big_fil_rev_8_21_14_0_20_41_12]|nr:MAG: alcohol dehydrogenase [Candidatus Omnitrophica bacterium CG11_big_fil_rev_8_21_14_0_20_41_12]
MQVAVYYNNRDIRIQEQPIPEIADDEILLQVKASGICGSDVLEWYRVKKAPLVLGHEVTGVIAKCGSKVKKFKAGDRVFVAHHVPCNGCRYCLAGNHTVCQTLQSTNFYPGGFSEYIRVPAINIERGMFMLPENISFEEGTFIEPLGCVLRGQRISDIKEGQTVLILGAGISGLLHLLLARVNKAARIVLTDINEYRLKIAKELGADLVINAKDDLVSVLRKENVGRLADQVIICTGALSAFHQGLALVERAGTIMCFAATDPGVTLPVPVNEFWRQSIKIMHSYGASPLDETQALELLETGKISVKKLITHRLNLKDAGLGFKLVAEAKDCIKVILETK